MSADREYTMYRQDARGTILVDLDDPVKSIAALLEKAKVDEEDAQKKVADYTRLLASAQDTLARYTEARVKFEEAYIKVTEDNDRLEDFPYHPSV